MPVAAIEPGEGVRLEGGELIRAAVVVSNADPKRTLALCDARRADAFRATGSTAWRSDEPGPQDQLRASPPADVHRRGRRPERPHRAMVTITTGIDATQAAVRRRPSPATRRRRWCELYFQTAYDPIDRAARRRTR